MDVQLFNTNGRTLQQLKPLKEEVGLYTCGPTVYGRAHLGNLRTFIFEDLLKRALLHLGYKVNHVMNITDVGHLVSDADDGEDKMQVGARRDNTTAWEIARKYTDLFMQDLKALNILPATTFCKATDHIDEQIALIATLEEKGYAYTTSDGVYYDTSKFPDYGKMAKLNLEGMQAGKRIDLGEKKNKTDFALWKFSPKDEQRDMEWDSPWGKGFPGWHLECSAMSMKYLGEQFDIHCGGIDHIPIHHTNEIAQSEAATGKKPWVNIWMHSEFLVDESGKLSKSKGATLNVDELKEKGFDPLAYRYFCLNTHYRKRLLFSWDSLKAAQVAFDRLKRQVLELAGHADLSEKVTSYQEQFDAALAHDLNTPQALAVMWDVLKDADLDPAEKRTLIFSFDEVFGLGLSELEKERAPQKVVVLAEKREQFRAEKNFAEADRVRDDIKQLGWIISDGKDGYELSPLHK